MSNLKLTKTDPGFTLKAEGDRLELDIFDEIDGGYWGGVSAKAIRDALKEHKDAKTIDVDINSPGGFVTESMAIYNMLHQHKAVVNVTIHGWAASGASIIAMAGDHIRMSEGAYMMIHRAAGLTMGNAQDHREQVDLLEKMDNQLAGIYAKRTGGDVETILDQMGDETWFTAQEAVDDGFADEVIEAKTKAAASFSADLLKRYQIHNMPGDVAARFTNQRAGTPEPQSETDPMKEVTPEAFAEQHPDAVKNWRDESAKTALDAERARISAIAEKWTDRPAFALEQIVNGNTLEQAGLAYTDVALAEINAKDKELAEAKAKAEANADGADPINLQGGGDGDELDDATKRHIKNARELKTKSAREAYMNSVGLDPELAEGEA